MKNKKIIIIVLLAILIIAGIVAGVILSKKEKIEQTAKAVVEEKRKKKAVLESVDSPIPSDKESLKAEVARLRKALKEESMRADLYNEIINVAEEQFKIPIRKKAGTKQ